MAGSIQISHLCMQANAALLGTLVNKLQGMRHASTPPLACRISSVIPSHPATRQSMSGCPTLMCLCDSVVCRGGGGERAVVLVDYLGGCAKQEVLCHPCEVRRDIGTLVSLLRRVFGQRVTVTSLYEELYSRVQSVDETLAEYSRALIRLHQCIEAAAPTVAERQALTVLGDDALKHQFVVGVRDDWVRHEVRHFMLRLADRPFIVVRGGGLCLMCEEEARVVQMRPVEKAAPGLSGLVSGSVSYVLGLDVVVLGDGGVSSGAVGRYVSVGDVSVSCGGDMELCGVDTVLSGAVSGGLCDLDRVSGGGDTDVSGVDSVVSGAVSGCLCDLDSVSRGDIIIIIIIQHLFLRHISSHCDHSEAHYSLKLTYLLSPLRACSHIRPTPRNAIVVCPLPALRPRPNSTRQSSSLAPRTFSTSLLVIPSSCFRRGSSAWLFLE